MIMTKGTASSNSEGHIIQRIDALTLDPKFIPPRVQSLMKKLESNGHTVYIVGGCVRDWLLGYDYAEFISKGGDFDLTTSATVEEMESIFNNFTHILDGKEFGTIKLVDGDQIYEITTYRIEGAYRDGRHPEEVIFSNQIEDDLSRRDFTINAMAADMQGNIVDPFHGKKDLKLKLVRTVGNPIDRFTEDYLRLFRAIRFATTLEFNIERETSNVIAELAESSVESIRSSISSERFLIELIKTLDSNGFLGIKLLSEHNLIGFITPLDNSFLETKNGNDLCKLLQSSSGDWMINLSIILHYSFLVEESQIDLSDKYLVSMATPNRDKEHILTLVKYFNPPIEYITKKWSEIGLQIWLNNILKQYKQKETHKQRVIPDLITLYHLQSENLSQFQEIKGLLSDFKNKLVSIERDLDNEDLLSSQLNGNDLIEMGFSGRIIGLILEELKLINFKDQSKAMDFVRRICKDSTIQKKEKIQDELSIPQDEPLLDLIQRRREKIYSLCNSDQNDSE